MKWRVANKVVKRWNHYRRSTAKKALAKGCFPTGYWRVYGRYSKRYPKGADRSALNPPDDSPTSDWNLHEIVERIWQEHVKTLALTDQAAAATAAPSSGLSR